MLHSGNQLVNNLHLVVEGQVWKWQEFAKVTCREPQRMRVKTLWAFFTTGICDVSLQEKHRYHELHTLWSLNICRTEGNCSLVVKLCHHTIIIWSIVLYENITYSLICIMQLFTVGCNWALSFYFTYFNQFVKHC